MKPAVSILLPTHNSADTLFYSLRSVLKQSFNNFEVLVVGDGCTDGTENLVTQMQRLDSRIQWFPFKKGKGFGYEHRNGVLKQASGTYIAFAAHDDLWFPDHLQKLVSALDTNKKTRVAYTRPLWVHPDGMVLPSTFSTNDPLLREEFITGHNEIPAQNFLYRNQDLKKVGYWNAKLPEAADWDVCVRILQLDAKPNILFIPTPTALHFRANWRTEESAWDSQLQTMYSVLRAGGYKPPLNPKKNEILQKTFYNTYLTSQKWKEVQKEGQSLVDTYARLVQPFYDKVRDLGSKVSKYKFQVAEVQKRKKHVEQQLRSVTSTSSYKVINRLRRILNFYR